MDEKVHKFLVSYFYVNTQLGGFNFGHCIIDATGNKFTLTLFESIVDWLKVKFENDVVILNVILLEDDRLDGLPEGLEYK